MVDSNTGKNDNQIKELDLNCAVCLSLLLQPQQLTCHHFFCKMCIDQLLDVDEQLKCPLCRQIQQGQIKINYDLDKKIQQLYPQQYKEKLKLNNEYYELQKKFEKIKIIVGNMHKLIDNAKKLKSNPELSNNHEWIFFIKLAQGNIKQYVNKIEIMLDPTFGDVPLILRAQPFEIKRVGYASFTLEAKIFFQKEYKLQPQIINYTLNFNNPQTQKCLTLKIDKSVLNQQKGQDNKLIN